MCVQEIRCLGVTRPLHRTSCRNKAGNRERRRTLKRSRFLWEVCLCEDSNSFLIPSCLELTRSAIVWETFPPAAENDELSCRGTLKKEKRRTRVANGANGRRWKRELASGRPPPHAQRPHSVRSYVKFYTTKKNEVEDLWCGTFVFYSCGQNVKRFTKKHRWLFIWKLQ